MQFSEHLPRLAKLADRLTVIRSMTHREGDHTRGGYLMRTGYVWDNQIAYPGLGCILGRELAEDKSPLPRFVAIGPRFNGIPQQDPGFLGAKYGPLNVEAPDSTFREVKPSELDLRVPPLEAFKALDKDNAEAMRKSVLEAFDLAAEKKAVRESYTMTPFGQSCLLARRLIEKGVPVVEVTFFGWDTHADNFKSVAKLSKALDGGFASLLTDLEERKLLDKTLIMWMGEFGRTPKINVNNGRDHWPVCFSVVLAGAKLKHGVVIGKTSADGFTIDERPVTVEELFATIYTAVDVNPMRQNLSNTGQPVRLVPKGTKAVAEALK